MSLLSCSCKCGKIEFVIIKKPGEIARCYCDICKKIHKKDFVQFAKYLTKDIKLFVGDVNVSIYKLLFSGTNDLIIIKSSNRAKRFFCPNCQDLIFMHYNESKNIWLATDIFNFDITNIDHYDIFKK
jgi:hypothetical protein